MLTVGWYRFRATLRRRWPGYLTIVLLVGLVGGVSMGAIAGARRTQSAFPAYLAATDASDLEMQVSSNVASFTSQQIEQLGRKLTHLPYVARVAIAPNLYVVPVGPNGRPSTSAVNDDDVTAIGSENGEYFTQDRVTVTEGRMADPKSASEMVATAEAAKLSGWHVGETVTFGAYTGQQTQSPSFNFATERPARRFSATLVGLVVFSSQVVNMMSTVSQRCADDSVSPKAVGIEAFYPSFGTPSDPRRSRRVRTVEKEDHRPSPAGTTPHTFHVTSVAEGQVERSSKPEAIALGVFGAIAGLAATSNRRISHR